MAQTGPKHEENNSKKRQEITQNGKKQQKNGNKKGRKRHETIKHCKKRQEPVINNKKLQEKAFRVNFEPRECPNWKTHESEIIRFPVGALCEVQNRI